MLDSEGWTKQEALDKELAIGHSRLIFEIREIFVEYFSNDFTALQCIAYQGFCKQDLRN